MWNERGNFWNVSAAIVYEKMEKDDHWKCLNKKYEIGNVCFYYLKAIMVGT